QEGFMSKAYYDVNGYAIGYGNHYYSNGDAVEEGDTISKSDAYNLLQDVVKDKEQAIRGYIKVPINEYQYAALISLAYNCGEGNLQRSTLLQLINSGADQDTISAQFEKTCVTAKGQYLPQLYTRRVAETTLFFSNVKTFVKNNPKTSIAIAAGAAGLVIAAVIYIRQVRKAA
ncbi:MAG TPA: lysozyme, partial [Puia sp.]|nr:lysozyme [Puia sp.]